MGLFDKFFGKKKDEMPEIIPEEVVKADIEKAQQAKKQVPTMAMQSQKKIDQTKEDHFEYKTKRCDFCGRKVEAMDMSKCNNCSGSFCEIHAPGGRHNCKSNIGLTMRKV